MDLILGVDNDLIIENGDFRTGESTYQEVKSLMNVAPGNIRENGYIGIDLANEIDEDGSISFKAELKKQLKLDGKVLKQYSIDGDKLIIDVENL